jgi:isocitrate dehydrogenase
MLAQSRTHCHLQAAGAALGRRAAGHVQARRASAVCNATHKIAVLSGDGIGPEIMAVALKVLSAAGAAEGESFEYTEALIGGAAIDATGDPYPEATERACKASDAVLLAAIGGYAAQPSPLHAACRALVNANAAAAIMMT